MLKSENYGFFKISLEEEVLIFEYLVEDQIDLERAQMMLDKRLEWTKDKPLQILSVFPKVLGMTKDARDLMGSDKAKEGLLASAVVTNSRISTLTANIFFSFNLKRDRKDPPIKLFTDLEKAKDWLKKLNN